MDPFNIPQDLSVLSPEDLADLETAVFERGEALSAEDPTDENVAELEQLALAMDAIEADQARRGEEMAARTQRKDAAASRFQRPEEGEDEIDAEVVEVEPTDEEAAEVVAEAEQIAAEAPEAVAASAPAPAVAPAVARSAMAAKRPAAAAPRPQSSGSGFMAATAHATMMKEGTPFEDPMELATQIAKKRNSFTVIPFGVRDFLPIASGVKEMEHSIGNDAIENFSVLRDLQVSTPALVASGAACAPYAPSYDFFRLAEPQNPMEQGTPVVQAPRGGIRYIVPPAVSAAFGAIDISAQDRDYEEAFEQFESGPKACLAVTCPAIAESEVSAVSQCVTFDNLNYKVFPEQVAAFLEDVAVQFTSVKEVFYLDFIDTNSTAVTADFGYGASRSLLRDWTLATVAYRKRHGMVRGAPLTVAAPDWALDVLKLDLALDGHEGLSMWDITDAQVLAALSARGIVPIWYNDNPTGVTPNQKFNAPQNAGALNPFPTQVFAYIYAPGTFVRLDGGTLDVGLVRDSTLNRTNDLQLFMEEWIGMAKLGFESVRLRSTVCPNGAGPAGVTPVTCA